MKFEELVEQVEEVAEEMDPDERDRQTKAGVQRGKQIAAKLMSYIESELDATINESSDPVYLLAVYEGLIQAVLSMSGSNSEVQKASFNLMRAAMQASIEEEEE